MRLTRLEIETLYESMLQVENVKSVELTQKRVAGIGTGTTADFFTTHSNTKFSVDITDIGSW